MRQVTSGQKTQLTGDIYPLPSCKFHYKWAVTKGQRIASVDDKGVLTISPEARPGDTFTVKTTAIVSNPYIKVKPSIVDYIVK